MLNSEILKFNHKGLIPIIAQDVDSGNVLMLAYANKEAIDKSIETGVAYYWSRSRNQLWLKGETSGNYQYIKDIVTDCDNDAVLYLVRQQGNACHTGSFSCFDYSQENSYYKKAHTSNDYQVLEDIYSIITERKNKPKNKSYTSYLFSEGLDKILKKIGEEASEVIIAAKNNSQEELQYEITDLLYHIIVLMVEFDINCDSILKEFIVRRNKKKALTD